MIETQDEGLISGLCRCLDREGNHRRLVLESDVCSGIGSDEIDVWLRRSALCFHCVDVRQDSAAIHHLAETIDNKTDCVVSSRLVQLHEHRESSTIRDCHSVHELRLDVSTIDGIYVHRVFVDGEGNIQQTVRSDKIPAYITIMGINSKNLRTAFRRFTTRE